MLETKRLIIRPFKDEDLDDFYAYCKVPGVGEKAGWPHHKSKAESKEILAHFIQNDEVFAIVHKTDQKVIGSMGLHAKAFDDNDQKYHQRELGYVLSKDYWNQGFMSEAVETFIDYAFFKLKLDRIVCSHFVENNASKRVIEKMGFAFARDDIYHSKALNQDFDEKKYVLYHPSIKTKST